MTGLGSQPMVADHNLGSSHYRSHGTVAYVADVLVKAKTRPVSRHAIRIGSSPTRRSQDATRNAILPLPPDVRGLRCRWNVPLRLGNELHSNTLQRKPCRLSILLRVLNER